MQTGTFRELSGAGNITKLRTQLFIKLIPCVIILCTKIPISCRSKYINSIGSLVCSTMLSNSNLLSSREMSESKRIDPKIESRKFAHEMDYLWCFFKNMLRNGDRKWHLQDSTFPLQNIAF